MQQQTRLLPSTNPEITLSRLRELVEYVPETGVFLWRAGRRKGRTAGTSRKNGYRLLQLDGVSYYQHRLAWFYVRGEWPINDVDHEDENKRNNAWNNLRLATKSQNQHNRSTPRNNTSGIKGVSWDAKAGKWCAQLSHNRVKHRLGVFTDKHEAALDVQALRDKLHGAFSNHGQ